MSLMLRRSGLVSRDRARTSSAARGAPRRLPPLTHSASLLATLAAVPMLALAGLAVDSARALLVESRLTAALAAAAPSHDSDAAALQSAVDAHFPSRFLDAQVIAAEVRTDRGGLTARAELPTTFLHILGHGRIAVTARHPAPPGATQLAGAQR